MTRIMFLYDRGYSIDLFNGLVDAVRRDVEEALTEVSQITPQDFKKLLLIKLIF